MKGERRTPNAKLKTRNSKRSFELGMEAIKALEPPHQNFFIADALLRPTLQKLINTESFHATVFLILLMF